MQRVEVTDPLQILVHVAVLPRSALAGGLSPPSGFTRVWVQLRRPPGGHPLKLLDQSPEAALLLFCSGSRCDGRVPHGQWALLDAHMLVLIDRSARLVEPCTCDRRIKCPRLTVRSRLPS